MALSTFIVQAKEPNKDTSNIQKHAGKLNEYMLNYLEDVEDSDEQEYIVVLRKGVLPSGVEDKGRVYDNIRKIKGKAKDIRVLLDNPSVERVEVNQELALFSDTVPWNVEFVNAGTSWNITNGTGIKVAILDTGVADHSDLEISGGYSVFNGSYADTHGHGTAVAGALAALLNEEGLAGVSPGVEVYAVKVFNDSNGSLSDALEGLDWTIQNEMDIVIMSFGFAEYSTVFSSAVNEAYENGVLLIAGSGKTGQPSVMYPAAYDDVIAVGAVDQNNSLASFSNSGPEIELVAPGVDVLSATLNNSYANYSGTSLAAPHVAGVAALIWGLNTTLTNEQVRGKLRNDAIDLGIEGKDNDYGFGLVWFNESSANYSYLDDVYYFELYNVSAYGTENETAIFWFGVTGSYQEVTFEEGYYYLNRYGYNETLHVSENGSVELLAISVAYLDEWSGDGSSLTDGVVWATSYGMSMKASGTMEEGECLDFLDTGNGYYDECYFTSTANLNACSGYFCVGGASCQVGSLGQFHEMFSGRTIGKRVAIALSLNVDTSCSIRSVDDRDYFVIDTKRSECNGAQYRYQGRYGGGANDWTYYSSSFSCESGSSCDPSQDYTTCTSQSCTPTSPCRRLEGQSCDETDGSVTNDCFMGLTCHDNICVGVDLAIVSITPIQVIPNVSMVKGKSGYIVVNVTNYGAINGTANVSATYDSFNLDLSMDNFEITNTNPRNISTEKWELFIFDFVPLTAGNNRQITANVAVVN